MADPNIVRKIVRLARVSSGDQVLEIGAGTGTLTRELAMAGLQVVSYEVDPRLHGLLEEVLSGLEVDLRMEDAMSLDLASVTAVGVWTVVANLPYNVGTSLVIDALRGAPNIKRMVVMVQSEVAHRLASPPGGKEYGLPSVAAQLHSVVHLAFTVPPQVFIPPPKVGSAVLVLERKPASHLVDEAIALATIAFRQRRKMLRGSLGEVVAPDNFVVAAVDATARPEQLAPTDYLRLAEVIHDR